ncbi:hypothetical protein HPP92_022970 [Vanilla planifolia]|uniref:Uncharacterized protein n=1 Tax=Vanilla planifolia TaxID=51239 RepID=A0A835PSB9_VANPL|nr:hypothetical protein HPP92_023210 [Vanilla planifolia]KAG0459842.1 hypothetical protein HPP92_022970 [Vanilla planifolia]
MATVHITPDCRSCFISAPSFLSITPPKFARVKRFAVDTLGGGGWSEQAPPNPERRTRSSYRVRLGKMRRARERIGKRRRRKLEDKALKATLLFRGRLRRRLRRRTKGANQFQAPSSIILEAQERLRLR